MTSKFALTVSVAAVALAIGSFATPGEALARSSGSKHASFHGGTSFNKAMTFKVSSNKHHHHHRYRWPIIVIGAAYAVCDGYIKHGICYEYDD